jgi:beta-glucosidase
MVFDSRAIALKLRLTTCTLLLAAAGTHCMNPTDCNGCNRVTQQPNPAASGNAGSTGTDWATERASALVAQMTRDEKIGQLRNSAPAIARLGVSAYEYWNEGLHGVLTDGATSFPQAIALGSTWDPVLVHRVASAISDEARGFNAKFGKGLTYWSPVINMLRDPRWGRYEESYTEDPYLMSQLGVAFVTGLQGDDPKYLKAVSTPKHFAANNSEVNRHTGSSEVDEQTLHEYYLPAFQATVQAGKAFSVMAAYNRLNGVPCSANTMLLRDILRNEWGFQGYVVSDCDAVADIVNGHHFVPSLAEAAGMALNAGTDLNCGDTYPNHLQEALDQGWTAEANIDTALIRVLRARVLLGEFDPPAQVPYSSITASVIQSEEHANLALQAARAAVVLLKNSEGLLPLDRTQLSSIAVIGPHSDDVILGGYSGSPGNTVSPLAGITEKLSGFSSVTINQARGTTITGDADATAIEAAVAAARASDVALVFVGTDLSVFREELDRPDWNLPGAQEELIEAVFAANPKTVVVLVTGGPLAVDWANSNVPALLTSFYDGQAQGSAIADVLFGDFNPTGRLSTTWYKGSTTLPPITDYDIRKGRTYLYFADAALYPFGHGLTYTTFAYDNLRLEPSAIHANGTATVSIDISNTGPRDGDELVQLYSRDVATHVTRPLKQLRRFQRVHIGVGQTSTVKFTLDAKDLTYWDVTSHGWLLNGDSFNLFVGASSADIRASSLLKVQP